MSIANSTRLLLCILISLVLSGVVSASAIGDTSPTQKTSKEVIIVSFDEFSSTDINSLLSYVSSLQSSIKDVKVTIKNYGNPALMLQDDSVMMVNEIADLVEQSNLKVVQEEEVAGIAPYFTITVAGNAAVQ